MSDKANPPGFATVNPYLIVDGAAAAIEFYERIFGATERCRFPQPDGRLGHAEIEIGDSVVMLADEFPERDIRGPKHFGGSPMHLLIYVADVDATFQRAIEAGAKEVRPVADQFYGDRSGTLEDPFGQQWTVNTHVEDVSPEELERRVAAMHAGDA